MNTEEKIKCSVCGNYFPMHEMHNDKNGKSICRTCAKKKKRRVFILIFLLLVALIAACVLFFVNNSTVEGNNQSVNVETPKVQVQDIPKFEMASATAVAPSNVSETIDNLQSFMQAMEYRTTEAEKSGKNCIVIDNISVFFGFNDAELNEEGKELILAFINAYKQTNNKAVISIKGYGCNIGSDIANDYVSKMRAMSVKELMVNNGISDNVIESNWYGKTKNSSFSYPEIKDYRRVIIGIK